MSFDLAYYLALWRLKKLPPDRVPEIAAEALTSGVDSSALRQLAGLSRPTSADVEPLMQRVAAEIGGTPLSEGEVQSRMQDEWLENAIPVARLVASQILDGKLDIAEGWLSLPYRDTNLGPLKIFFEHDLPDSSVAFDGSFRARVLAAAQRFLNPDPASRE